MEFMSGIKKLKTSGGRRELAGVGYSIVSLVAIGTSLYQIWSSTFGSVQPLLHRSIHLTLILLLAFLIYTPHAFSSRKKIIWTDAFLSITALMSGIYYASQIERYLGRWPLVDPLTSFDVVAACLIVILVLEATRRTMGIILPIIALVFLAYALFGHLLPGFLYHRLLEPVDVLDQLVFTVNGIYSSPIAVASTFVFLFVLFGVFFANSGAGEFFYKFSLATAGRSPGGAAKVAIVASALFGSINGSPTANVVTTGSFTIPMMKRTGYSPLFAGAVEAVASTGGGMLPPIMGTAAFLMVEMAGIPYRDIAIAAALPGILYFLALGFMVHLRAKKIGLTGLSSEDIPPLGKTLQEGCQFFLPLIVLVVMLALGYTPSLTAVGGIIAVIIVSWFRKETRMGLKKIVMSLDEGARSAVVISMSCAVAGIVICGLMTTGLSGKIASLVLSFGGGMQLVALFITAILCILLGMGMPVAAAYALTAALAIPSLYELGVAPLPAHLFVVYFATMSAITPPIAVAAYAAAGIAGADPSKIGWAAVKLGIVSFIVPFMFVIDPSLLISVKTLGLGTLWVIATSLLGVYSLSIALEGWLFKQMRFWEQVIAFGAGLMLMFPNTISDYLGITMFLLVLSVQKIWYGQYGHRKSART
ncbi:MAG: TRAP transporter permease [Bacillota bacterium]